MRHLLAIYLTFFSFVILNNHHSNGADVDSEKEEIFANELLNAVHRNGLLKRLADSQEPYEKFSNHYKPELIKRIKNSHSLMTRLR